MNDKFRVKACASPHSQDLIGMAIGVSALRHNLHVMLWVRVWTGSRRVKRDDSCS
jgi:hypothetical protein